VGAGAGRPLLEGGPAAALARLSEERAPLYSDLADLVFDVDTMTPPQVVEHILAELHERAGAGHA
jgi:shikimate kinase